MSTFVKLRILQNSEIACTKLLQVRIYIKGSQKFYHKNYHESQKF